MEPIPLIKSILILNYGNIENLKNLKFFNKFDYFPPLTEGLKET